jgi:predicted NBD/HSP70 family sugar kinase
MAKEAILHSSGTGMGNRSLLRRLNSLGVLRAVQSGPQTMRELASASGLSRTAIDGVVSDLLQLGWLNDESSPSGRLGRPAAQYRVDDELGLFLSIDIGANHIYAIATDLGGGMRGQLTEVVHEDLDAEARIARALATADGLLSSIGSGRDSVWIVTIASPGAITREGAVLYFGGTGMPGWAGLNLRERFAREFAAAVLVEGDVPLGAQAEIAFGAASGRSDVIYVLCGRRTSGALIVGGRVHRGVHGAAGIVGEMPELKWRELNEEYGSGVLPSPRPSRERIFQLAREGDAAARLAVDEFADDLATGAAALTLTVDPELLIIGGGSSAGADVFLPRFVETLSRICPVTPPVAISSLGSEAVALGGISLAAAHLDAVLEKTVRDHDAFPSPAEAVGLVRQG